MRLWVWVEGGGGLLRRVWFKRWNVVLHDSLEFECL